MPVENVLECCGTGGPCEVTSYSVHQLCSAASWIKKISYVPDKKCQMGSSKGSRVADVTDISDSSHLPTAICTE